MDLDNSGTERPRKRVKVASPASQSFNGDTTSKRRVMNGRKSNKRDSTKTKQNLDNNEHVDNSASTTKSNKAQQFSQPSIINVGDKGIFVTADKGQERKCLIELNDLVNQYLDRHEIDAFGKSLSRSTKDEPEGDDLQISSIEADIATELASMRSTSNKGLGQSGGSPIRLITLDIPCVSFLRLPPASSIDPVHLVHKICAEIATESTRQKSRYIRRLTPISTLGKTLSGGLEKICDEVLPRYFGPDEEGEVRSIKFAVRPTTRNNDKLDRDSVIQHVAGRVQELGRNLHRVDLKNYDKAVLIEVYRGWVGISVVDNTSEIYHAGFEKLKRFNLAEIYTETYPS